MGVIQRRKAVGSVYAYEDPGLSQANQGDHTPWPYGRGTPLGNDLPQSPCNCGPEGQGEPKLDHRCLKPPQLKRDFDLRCDYRRTTYLFTPGAKGYSVPTNEGGGDPMKDKDVLNWLLEEDQPAIRYLALTELLGRPQDDARPVG